jgi:hypothetical protein
MLQNVQSSVTLDADWAGRSSVQTTRDKLPYQWLMLHVVRQHSGDKLPF